MLSNYIRTFIRHGRSHLGFSLVQLMVTTTGMTGLLFFAAGYVHGVYLSSIWKFLLYSTFMVLVSGLLLERRRYLNGNKELAVRNLFGALESDLFIQLSTESLMLNLAGSVLTYVLLDLSSFILQITRTSMSGFHLTDIHSLSAFILLVFSASVLSSTIPFLTLAYGHRRSIQL